MARAAPPRVVTLLLAALAAQAVLHGALPGRATAGAVLHDPPPVAALRLASCGDDAALARIVVLYLHGADAGVPLRELDYGRVARWLDAALALDPRDPDPLLAAGQIYGAVADPDRVRVMLDLIERAFAADPEARWPAMAQAALLARHRLHDMALARRYAQAIRLRAPAAPAWARQLEIFILQDMHELDSARAVTGALLAGGTITDPHEVRFLEQRLRELERQAAAATR